MKTELQSKRLTLIQTENQHASELFVFWTDPDVTRFMNMDLVSTIDEVMDMITLSNRLAEINQAIRYTMLIRNTNEIIGSCGFNYIDFENGRAEIGYDLGKGYWGEGYGSEAVWTLIDYWFHVLGMNRVEAKVDPENSQSIKLLEKVGFQFEGRLRQSEKSKEEYKDVMMYSKLKSDPNIIL
ncbi:GNAT family N-acetyltransferase [Bacillus sp. V3B]|uniref:GNAT family N-acetyltransferase n=1 Tax=Bacillus sp. V3B TaxID=2804915 RepID=UPI00210A9445|nr:GNAT family N-acetyltransferase [Bacillus sp. V3B]MCQ6275047.1 GNAT family N-acetyltransferase [Bacillus sp. V3B]